MLISEWAHDEPTRDPSDRASARFGITIACYDPPLGGESGTLIHDNTRLIWCESLGSVTMEAQYAPAITPPPGGGGDGAE